MIEKEKQVYISTFNKMKSLTDFDKFYEYYKKAVKKDNKLLGKIKHKGIEFQISSKIDSELPPNIQGKIIAKIRVGIFKKQKAQFQIKGKFPELEISPPPTNEVKSAMLFAIFQILSKKIMKIGKEAYKYYYGGK